MRRIFHVAIASLALAGTMVLAPRDASACGGCFAPPESPTIVTDHRMILSISKDQTTLYDQIRYQGAPASFAWVLPVSGTVEVGLSADIVFGSLDQLTRTQIIPPPRNCPPPPQCDSNSRSAGSTSSDAAAAPNEDVTVTKREVVGPYETVQLHATDAGALQTWLTNNGFSIPADVKPVVDKYVSENFDFLALKLLPGKGVQDMRPVRVTTKGASPVLPLRMVAAGAGATVGISLWLIGEGRYEPQNFPTFTIKAEELAWDWNANRSNYTDLRAQRTTAGGGKAWELESSEYLGLGDIKSAVTSGSWSGADPAYVEQQAQQDYLPVKNPDGTILKTATQVRDEDLSTLFYGIGAATSRVTRMRADLTHAALDTDLVLTASADQGGLDAIRSVTKELNQPQCPVFSGCDQIGTAPRDEAAASSSGTETFQCSTASTGTSQTWLGAGLGYAALALVRGLRRKRR